MTHYAIIAQLVPPADLLHIVFIDVNEGDDTTYFQIFSDISHELTEYSCVLLSAPCAALSRARAQSSKSLSSQTT